MVAMARCRRASVSEIRGAALKEAVGIIVAGADVPWSLCRKILVAEPIL